jgi:predicted nucleotide-binding protein
MSANKDFEALLRSFQNEYKIFIREENSKPSDELYTELQNKRTYDINTQAFIIAKHKGEKIQRFGEKGIELFIMYLNIYKIINVTKDEVTKIVEFVNRTLISECSFARTEMRQYAASKGMESQLNIDTYQFGKELENKINPIAEKLRIEISKYNITKIKEIEVTEMINEENEFIFADLIKKYEKLKENATYENQYKDDYHTLKIEKDRSIIDAFGESELKRFNGLPTPGVFFLGEPIDKHKELEEYKSHINKIISKLKGYINKQKVDTKMDKAGKVLVNSVFIVHGHNEEMKQSVARVIEKQGIETIILHEKSNRGKTIIEKIEANSDVNAAIVLFSADDYGFKKSEDCSKAKLRPRQNVIFEMGLFIGKLGRENVICLYEKDINMDILSDYQGVLFIPYISNGKWKLDLGKELREIGFNFDLNEI